MIKTKAELKEYIISDLKARGLKKLPLFYSYRKPLLGFTVLLRKVEYLINSKPFYIPSIFVKHQSLRLKKKGAVLGLSICPNTCGKGLYIVHWGSVVISSEASVGENARIHSCVNIGKNEFGAPIIGDNVYIGPGAKIFGDILVGDNVKIGANAVVNKSFDSNVTVAGVPAKVLGSNKL